ncbi:MAG: aryl-sulfate sulfotransferase [Planctomycetota bacterium]|nr:aryl-sulfate sulfotransferase [Planctomycetota bacterium]MDP6989121.1 aryl-sulfate sulfotransferase [Planctomycetota bacterium]
MALLSSLLIVLLADPAGGATQDDPAPDAEPASERGLVQRSEGAFEGLTLFTPIRSTSTYLVDMDGEVVHTWKSDHPPGQSVYLLENGHLLRTAREGNPVFSGGGEGGRLQEFSWDGELLWDFVWSDQDHLHHHDIEPLPGGNVLLIAWEGRTREEAIAAGRDPSRTHAEGIWPDCVVEIEPVRPDGGKVVWEWHAWDHLIQDYDPKMANYGDVTAHPERIDVNADHRSTPAQSDAERRRLAELEEEMRKLGYIGDDEDEEDPDAGGAPPGGPGNRRDRLRQDWLHTNGIDYHAELDLIVLSLRSLSEVWVIDHSTTTEEAAGSTGGRHGKGGDLLYRWGFARNYGMGQGSPRVLYAQHDARWIEGVSPPRLTIFNNGEGRPDGQYSTVEEIELPYDAKRGFLLEEGGAFGPTEPAWTYAAPGRESFFSAFISGAQRLLNGNTLVCSGARGRVFEVTAEGEIVWEYLNPFGGDAPLGRRGGPPDRRGGPPGGPAPGRRGPPGGRGRRGPRGGPGGGPGMDAKGLFRATRIPLDHPGLADREL